MKNDLVMKPNSESESAPENLLEKAEAELQRQVEAGELDKEEIIPGVAHHQVDVHIFEPATNRYRGHLCIYGQCPKGKPECDVPGCGAQRFLQLYENFQISPRVFAEQPCVVLYQAAPRGETKVRPPPAPAP